jgi:monoamine oxidase
MARSPLFAKLAQTLRSAQAIARRGLPTREGLDAERAERRRRQSRRQFLAAAGGIAATGAALAHPRLVQAAPKTINVDVAIVGAGLAGLVCADRLEAAGVVPTLYDASYRVGGRCFTLGGEFGGPVTFPGQVAERGGELIDNLHKTMLAYAQEFDLEREDLSHDPGDVLYYFDGAHVPEDVIVDEYRDFVDAMRDDLLASTGAPTAALYNDADFLLDNTSLAEYLETRGAGPNVYKAIEQAYVAEYGRELDEQSSLNFLLFIHADRRSKFTPFGVYSDERFHLVHGNEQIPARIFERLAAPTWLGHKLVRARKTAAGKVELTFKSGNKTVTKVHDAAVFAMPFSVLRDVELDPSLTLPPEKHAAITELGYGMNAKTMIGFDARPWLAAGCNGGTYADLANVQATWETNPALAAANRAIITDYSGGVRGATLGSVAVQTAASQFLAGFDLVIPGAAAAATRLAGNKLRVHREHWPSNPLTKGSYTCYLPGQFTSVAGNEGTHVGNVYFAGEHANSFYEWQGFMEGACLSGIDAADAILADWG